MSGWMNEIKKERGRRRKKNKRKAALKMMKIKGNNEWP